MVTFTHTKKHEIMGAYTPTTIDNQKAAADFLLVQVAPFYIRWKGGKGEVVTARKLESLKKTHSWATDF